MASKIKISELPALTGTVADSYNIPIDDGSTTYKVSVSHFEEAAANTASQYAAAAAASAEAAAGSAGEAATTATTIETDIGTATRLVNDARGYASSAADSVTAAQAASGAATTKANEASNSANAAAGSAGEAAASATTASNYVTNAEAEANRAKSWADYPNATGSSGDATHNAHYWADVAQAIAGGGVTSFNGRGGVVVSEAGDYSAGMISYDNTSSGLTATDAQAAIDEVNTDLNTLDTNKANASQLAAVEDGETSSAAYTAGDYISRNGVLYEVIAAIAIGDSFTVGTNIQATTVGDEVEAIKTDLSDLDDEKLDIADYAKTGCVNIGNNKATTKTLGSSVVFTVNSDKSVTVNGTNSSGTWLDFKLDESMQLKAGETYYISGCRGGSTNPYTYAIQLYGNTSQTGVYQTDDVVSYTSPVDQTAIWRIAVWNNASLNNQLFKPMISTEPNMPYAPYAMTNRELTERIGTYANNFTTLNTSTPSTAGWTHLASFTLPVGMWVLSVGGRLKNGTSGTVKTISIGVSNNDNVRAVSTFDEDTGLVNICMIFNNTTEQMVYINAYTTQALAVEGLYADRIRII